MVLKTERQQTAQAIPDYYQIRESTRRTLVEEAGKLSRNSECRDVVVVDALLQWMGDDESCLQLALNLCWNVKKYWLIFDEVFHILIVDTLLFVYV